MEIEWVIAHLRARCPSFAQRVAGAAEYKPVPEAAALSVPCAFVIPLDDNPQEPMSLNGVRQRLIDSFAVVVAVSNRADEIGQASRGTVTNLRAELWAALLGWRPVAVGGNTADSRYDGIAYQGGQLLALDRARLWYQFEFGAPMEICPEDGYQEIELAALPAFDGFTIKLDISSPSDPNRADPQSGMDGRIEAGATVTGLST